MTNRNISGNPMNIDPMSLSFDPRQYIQSLSAPMNETANPGSYGPKMPEWRNPYAYTTFGDAGGIGSYLGANAPLFMGGLEALSGGIQAYTGLQGLKLAKDAFKQQKREFNINLANQTQSYNTAVGDRISGRHYASEEERIKALSQAQLTDRSNLGNKG